MPIVPELRFDRYYRYDDLTRILHRMAEVRPDLMSVESIGRSFEGRDIWAVRVSNAPDVDQAKPRAFLDAMHHAREPQGMMSLIHFIYHLGSSYGVDPFLTQLVDSREIWVIPIVNPDGYVYNESTNPNGGGYWRKNRRINQNTPCIGVDLNRNYSVGWGGPGSSSSPCSDTYRGTAAFSEPESTALSNFYLAKGTFGAGNSIHTYGLLHLYPWGYTSAPNPDNASFMSLGLWHTEMNHYKVGPVYTTIYPASGVTVDWAYGATGAFAYTSEIGQTFWPSQSLIVPLALENIESFTRLVAGAGPLVRKMGHTIAEFSGNGNGFLNQKETGTVDITVQNYGALAASNVSFSISSGDAALTVHDATVLLPSVAPFATASSAAAGTLSFRVEKTAVPGSEIPLALTIAHDGFLATEILPVRIGTPAAIFFDDFEGNLGWTVGGPGDSAPPGSQWGKADPSAYSVSKSGYSGSISFAVQPADDASPSGTLCWVTGGATPGSLGDLDGQTTLVSPLLDLSASANPRVTFSRWFASFNAGLLSDFTAMLGLEDSLRVEVSNDGGSTWTSLVTVAPIINPTWTGESFSLGTILPVTSQMQLRAVAADASPDSTVEALFDDFRVDSYPPDLNTYVDTVDVAVAIAAAPEPVMKGETLTYTITVANQGPDDAKGVVLTNPRPPGAGFLSAAASQGQCQGSAIVSCALGDLPPGGLATIEIQVTPSEAGSLVGTAEVVQTASAGIYGVIVDVEASNDFAAVASTVTDEPSAAPAAELSGGGGGGCFLGTVRSFDPTFGGGLSLLLILFALRSLRWRIPARSPA